MKPVRILHCPIGNMNVGGIENMLMQIYRKIDRSRFQFDFIVHDKNENFYENEILSLGGKLYKIPYISKEPREHIRQYRNILENHPEYQIIHIHTTYSIMYFDAKIAKKLGRNIVVHSHNNNATLIHKLFHFCFRNKLSHIADYRLSCSVNAGKWLFSKRDNYIVWKNAIMLRQFQYNEDCRRKIRNNLGIKEDEKLIGNVARLSYQKNQSLLLDIYQQYAINNPKSKLILIGSGEDEESLKEKAKKLNLDERVIFTGNKKNVNEYMMAIDIFCLTSRWEGFGISILEAQTSGCVVLIGSNLYHTFLDDFINVHIVRNYRDKKQWVYELEQIVPNSEDERKKRFFQMYDLGYDIDTQTDIVTKFYEEITKELNDGDTI